MTRDPREAGRDVVMTRPDESISLVLVDDANVVTAGLRALVERQRGFTVIDEAATAAQAVALDADPDVVISDIELTDAHGAEVVSLLSVAFKRAALLALTLIDDVAVVQRVLDASGYVLNRLQAVLPWQCRVPARLHGRRLWPHLRRLLSDAAADSLPQVSWVNTSIVEDEHPRGLPG